MNAKAQIGDKTTLDDKLPRYTLWVFVVGD